MTTSLPMTGERTKDQSAQSHDDLNSGQCCQWKLIFSEILLTRTTNRKPTPGKVKEPETDPPRDRMTRSRLTTSTATASKQRSVLTLLVVVRCVEAVVAVATWTPGVLLQAIPARVVGPEAQRNMQRKDHIQRRFPGSVEGRETLENDPDPRWTVRVRRVVGLGIRFSAEPRDSRWIRPSVHFSSCAGHAYCRTDRGEASLSGTSHRKEESCTPNACRLSANLRVLRR